MNGWKRKISIKDEDVDLWVQVFYSRKYKKWLFQSYWENSDYTLVKKQFNTQRQAMSFARKYIKHETK